jgi:hypothetical protein
MLCSVLTVITEISSTQAAVVFGQTSKGGVASGQPAGVMVGSRFVCSSGGVPSSISVYIANPSGVADKAVCAIYQDSNKMLFAVSEEKTISARSDGWVTFNLASASSLVSGSSYSLVVWFKGSYCIVYYSGTSSVQSWYAAQWYSGSFPSGPYSGISGYCAETGVYSIYCTVGSSSSSPTSTPTPTATATPTPISQVTTTFGQTSKSGVASGQPAGVMVGSRFVCSSGGVPSSISVYIANPSGVADKAVCAIYQDSNKMLFAVSEEKTISARSDGWVTFNLASASSLVSGSSYSLVVWFKGSYCIVYYSGTSSVQSWYAAQWYSGSFPSGPYSGISGYCAETGVYSIYCTVGSSSSSPTSTPTPTATATPTPTSTPSGQDIRIIKANYASYAYTPQQTVTYSDLWIGHWDAVSALAVPAKSLRSDFTALVYFNSLMVYSQGNNNPSGTFTTFKNNGWLLKDTSGRYVTDSSGTVYYVDFGNSNVWNWYANWLSGIIRTYDLDGVQMDNTCFDTEAFYYASTGNVVNPRTGSVWTDTDVVNAYIGYINTLRNYFGNDKIILCNGIYNGYHFERNVKHDNIEKLVSQSSLSGFISEGWLGAYSPPWLSEDAWRHSLDMAVWMQDNVLATRSNGIFMAVCPWASTNPDIYGSLNGVSSNQYTAYCVATMLLAAEYSGNALFLGATDSYSQALFNIDVGSPLNSYYVIGGTHVYARDYSDGKILVNPTSSSYTVQLTGSYITQDGVNTGNSITVPAHSGLILKER